MFKNVTAASNMLRRDHKNKYSIKHYYSPISSFSTIAHFKTLAILQTLCCDYSFQSLCFKISQSDPGTLGLGVAA